jgi:hypothetical protein
MKNAMRRNLDCVAANVGISGVGTWTKSRMTDTKDVYVGDQSIGNKALAGVTC